MPLQYITSSESDFSLGIDARSAENQILQGFVRDLLNADIVEKRVRKRTGYQGYAGNVPVRITSFEYINSTNQMLLTIDSASTTENTSIDLSAVRSTPIILYGRSSSISSGGPFTSAADTVKYYSGFTVPTRKTFVNNTATQTLSITNGEHGLGTTNIFSEIVEATDTVNRSHSRAIPHEVISDESSFDIDIQYTNATGADKEVYVYYKSRTASSGEAHIETLSHTGSGSESFTISAATHGLDNFNIILQVQEDLGSTRGKVTPDLVVIQPDGDVVITLTNSTATTYYVIMSAAPVGNLASGNISGNTTSTITLTDLTSPWFFYSIYMEQTVGGDKELVLPDIVEYDDDAASATLTFTNNSSTARNFIVYYEYGIIRSNQLSVTDATISVDDTDSRPQLTLWGLDHSEIYGMSRSGRSGWTTHIDSYKSSGERRLVCGLGGNLFSARTYDEVGTSYNYALLYPNLQARTSANKVLGPLFWDDGDTPARTRGYITSTSSGTNWATVSAVSYDSGNEWTKYTLSLPDKQILDSSGAATTLSAVLSTTTNLEDWLTVQGMSYSRHNGTFKIRQIQDGTDEIFIWVENDDNSADYDDSGVAGEAGVFTDQLTWTVSAPFIPEDLMINAAFGEDLVCTALSSSSSTTVIDGIVDTINIAGGLLTSARRTSSVVPMRIDQPSSTASVEDLVRGDMLSYSGIDRLLRVRSINPDSDRTVSISEDDGVATVTLSSGNTDHLSVGNKILLVRAGVYSGPQEITEILTNTTFTFDTEETGTVASATLLGSTIEVDEELEWEDSVSDSFLFTVEERWIPIEAPDDSYNQTLSTYIRHLDSNSYSEQSFLRSTTVLDTMYLTNYDDEVYKFDGTNLYRAGLFPWQPGLFITQETGATAEIVADNPTSTPTDVVDNVFHVPLGDEKKFPIGSRIRHSFTGGSNDYEVLSTYDDMTEGFVKVRRISTTAISLGTSPVLTLLSTLRYYFRLNAVDANNNIIASAVTGYQDHVVELAADAAVQLKLIGLPAWDVYDYDRLEVEIYRTRINQVAPFYKITTLQMDFDNTQGYVNYTDVFSDTDLIDLDPVSTALLGEELGISWQEPLRAKYITSIGNKLVLANIKDYPQLDVQIVASGAVTNTTYAGKIFTFRKNSTDTGTTTDMINRVAYECINGVTGTTSNFSIGSDQFSFDTSINTNAVEGDWIYLTYNTVASTGRDLTYSGWWQIEAVSGATVTVNLVGAAAATTYPDRYVIASDPTNIPVLLGTDGNLGMVNGDSFDLFDLMRRISLAINTSMRMVDTSLSAMEDFIPWMVARGGNDVGKAGRLIVRQPRVESTTIELLLPSSFSGGGQSFQIFVNGVRRSTSDQISASSRVYPSRLLVSYENYPEIFDNPTAVLDTESDSVVDVNSADGQQITGIIPFFGESAFGAAQQSGVLVVFKSNSVYLVDINEKKAGRNPVQKLKTGGLGCTAPYSIAVTQDGILFANESGIYCLLRDQTIQYVGRFMERNWINGINLDQLAIVQGHHYGLDRMYKLSVPIDDEEENSEVYTYTQDENTNQLGAWSRYDNHPATGWANLEPDAFFSSTRGRVFSLRRTGSETDFRDDNEAIQFTLDTRAMDFGNPGIRKVLNKLFVNYRTLVRNAGTEVSFSVDLSQEYNESTQAILRGSRGDSSGVDDYIRSDIEPIEYSTNRRKGTYFQVRVSNNTIDENVEIAGLEFRIAGLSDRGMVQAKDTESR